jgi:hypothetical protein
MMRLRTVFPLMIAAALACGGTNRTEAGQLLTALDSVRDDQTVAVLFVGMGEAGLGGQKCAEALRTSASVDPAQRAMIFAQAIESCPDVCFPESKFRALADLDPEARRKEVISFCDAAGPDPVFGGDLAASRMSMDPISYLVARMVVEAAWHDLGKDSVEGRKLDALRPKIARSLVLQAEAAKAP